MCHPFRASDLIDMLFIPFKGYWIIGVLLAVPHVAFVHNSSALCLDFIEGEIGTASWIVNWVYIVINLMIVGTMMYTTLTSLSNAEATRLRSGRTKSRQDYYLQLMSITCLCVITAQLVLIIAYTVMWSVVQQPPSIVTDLFAFFILPCTITHKPIHLHIYGNKLDTDVQKEC